MRNKVKAITTIVVVGAMTVGVYLFGTMQATDVKEVEKVAEAAINSNPDIVNMKEVIGWDIGKGGLQLHFKNGEGYFLEK